MGKTKIVVLDVFGVLGWYVSNVRANNYLPQL